MKEYSKEDMLAFADEIGREHFKRYVAGTWYTDKFKDRPSYTTEELLNDFDKTRIPPLPDPNDLEHLKFGQQSGDTQY